MAKITTDIEVEIEVWCSCGNGLCNVTTVDGTSITVEPCEVCMEAARQDGYDDGYSVGYEEAREKFEE